MPKLSKHFQNRKPSSIRMAQILFAKRKDAVKAINVAVGNVSLPTYPKILERMRNLCSKGSPFENGVVRYTSTTGMEEAQQAFFNIIKCSEFETSNLYCQVTDGGSAAMELVMVGVCGEPLEDENALLLLDPAYTNYNAFARRLGRKTISIKRYLQDDGLFSLPDIAKIEELIIKEKPNAVLVIPYDNPTGQFFSQEQMNEIAKLCVKYDLWMISDEAYRELYYNDGKAVSIWGISEEDVSGIFGRRISIESASKIWNACGIRIGAIVTDNFEFHEKCVAENTTNLCANALGQYVFGSLAKESKENLQKWYKEQREYYSDIGNNLVQGFAKELPKAIVSRPDSALYAVVDVRNLVDEDFDAEDFVAYCASEGLVEMCDERLTLLVSPIIDFYSNRDFAGKTQMRIAFVEDEENMQKIPHLFKSLLRNYMEGKRYEKISNF